MAYEERYRKRAIEYREEGHTLKETAKVFKIGTATIGNWEKQYKQTGSLKKKPLNRSFKKIDPEKLKAYIEQHPDAYLSEMAQEFSCSDVAISKALKRLNITRKKRRNCTGNKTR
jgi:transposase